MGCERERGGERGGGNGGGERGKRLNRGSEGGGAGEREREKERERERERDLLAFDVCCLGFRVQGLGLGVSGFGFRVETCSRMMFANCGSRKEGCVFQLMLLSLNVNLLLSPPSSFPCV